MLQIVCTLLKGKEGFRNIQESRLQNQQCKCFGVWQAIRSRLKCMTKETREGRWYCSWCWSSYDHHKRSLMSFSYLVVLFSYLFFFFFSFFGVIIHGRTRRRGNSVISTFTLSFVIVVWKWSKWLFRDVVSASIPSPFPLSCLPIIEQGSLLTPDRRFCLARKVPLSTIWIKGRNGGEVWKWVQRNNHPAKKGRTLSPLPPSPIKYQPTRPHLYLGTSN